MKKYQYQILRYVHDQFTGEFVNLGVVVYSPDELFLKASVSQRYGRITAMFPNANGKFIAKIAKNFESSIKEVSSQLTSLFRPSENLSIITKSILPQDDSALILTEVRHAIDIEIDTAISDLFHDLVEKYLDKTSEHTLSDEDVWRKKYKSYFDKYRITNRLTSHEVSTKNDSFLFDKSWKNEIWHCYQPISFNLHSSDAIKNKVYRWSGILREMDTSNEKIHITFLATLSDSHQKLNDFIKQSLDQNSDFVEVDVVLESDAELIAQKISNQILEHDDNS
ncbi:DUF3037 domain-containing protein [Arcicella lustrica]|uniref:DUF3037 domain-containing protein n=1 Tax=Arcicella lustrica TaxID=2984196 RepID=A0ABU5SJ64_9BACT|nr:DUF3037 domain-containing protein [Arcicella sp. DC25W]MEA5427330.1 DUF3037 domain-containing protein [Arcicella sp. DC25W]